jgi:hypothetical protein
MSLRDTTTDEIANFRESRAEEVSELRTRQGKFTQSGETTAKNKRRMGEMRAFCRLFVAYVGIDSFSHHTLS